jgi:serine/threonine protein phosphatase PrpC
MGKLDQSPSLKANGGASKSKSSPSVAHIKRMSVRLAESNDPCEDRYAVRSSIKDGIQLFGVFDGHGGYLAGE